MIFSTQLRNSLYGGSRAARGSAQRLGFVSFVGVIVPALFFLSLTALSAAEGNAAEQAAAQKAAEEKFLKIRTEAINKWDGDFFVEEKFTPEQVQLFITTRLAAEDRVMTRMRKTPGAILLPSQLAAEMDSAFAKAFNPEIAQRYRAWVNTMNVWIFMMDNPILNAREWLTADELCELAQVWGPIMAESMDETYKPDFSKSPEAEQLAFYDKTVEGYTKAANKILDPDKFVKLKARFAEMRLAAKTELEQTAP